MYKLMVVDDELRQVKALANILKQLRPEYEIFTAEDGQEALSFISNTKVDILFTDIRMPNIDGLQLIEKLSLHGTAVKTIILSGYDEFEYAQKAIRFGVNDYIVKPVSKADLEDVLTKVESCIQAERNAKEQAEDLKKNLNNSLPVYLERQLNKWVQGNTNKNERDEIESIFQDKEFGTVMITALSLGQVPQQEIRDTILQYAKFSIKETLDPIGHSISFLLENEKDMIATVLVSRESFNLQSNDNVRRLELHIKRLKDEFGIKSAIGVGERSGSIFGDITELFNKAQRAAELRFFLGLERIIFYSDNNTCSNTTSLDMNALENEISEAVRRKDKTMVSKATSNTMGNIHCQFGIKPSQFKEGLLHLLLNQVKSVCNILEEERYRSLTEGIKTRIRLCEEYSELWHFTNETLYQIIDISDNSLNDKNAVIINKCKKFIDENYMRDISLEVIAQKYYFNPSYFSNLFKSHLGLGFSEYLLKVRIQNAKKLLRHTEDNMFSVSARVGFKDPAYFSRMFKRETGISPLKYRQMNEK